MYFPESQHSGNTMHVHGIDNQILLKNAKILEVNGRSSSLFWKSYSLGNFEGCSDFFADPSTVQ